MPAKSEEKKENVLGMALTYGAKPDKEQLATILFFFKQIVSVIIGVALGGLKLSGFLGLIM
jgi:hypothetical protein